MAGEACSRMLIKIKRRESVSFQLPGFLIKTNHGRNFARVTEFPQHVSYQHIFFMVGQRNQNQVDSFQVNAVPEVWIAGVGTYDPAMNSAVLLEFACVDINAEDGTTVSLCDSVECACPDITHAQYYNFAPSVSGVSSVTLGDSNLSQNEW